MTTHDVVVGFDLGDGESALARVVSSKAAEPAIIDLHGSRRPQHVTAVGDHPTRGILVGDEAMSDDDVSPLYLAFKSRALDDPDVRTPIELFVRRVVSDVERYSDVDLNQTLFTFGTPSSWSASDRAAYTEILKDAGITLLDVVAESRAALLFARESGELSAGDLQRTVLIVDIGSSTTDYTVMRPGEEVPEDMGNPVLGARLIDRELLSRAINAHPERDRIKLLLEEKQAWRARLELHCRLAKENFFSLEDAYRQDPTQVLSSALPLRAPGGKIYFEVELNVAQMDAVIGAPLVELAGLSWREALEQDFRKVKTTIAHDASVVLLTGGPSRMSFVKDVCADVFPQAKIVTGVEPEFAIARGLSLAGRTATRVEGFRAAVGELLASDQISGLVRQRLPTLLESMGEAIADGIVAELILPAFVEWRNGGFRTLADLEAALPERAESYVQAKQDTAVKPVIVDWLNRLQPEIATLTVPICRRYHLASDALTLAPVELKNGRVVLPVDTELGKTMVTNLSRVVNSVLAGATAMLLFGIHGALIAGTGPFGVIVAAYAMLKVLGRGTSAVLEDWRNRNIPMVARRAVPEGRLRSALLAKAPAQEREIAATFVSTAQEGEAAPVEEMVKAFVSQLEAQLEHLAREAELLIRTKDADGTRLVAAS